MLFDGVGDLWPEARSDKMDSVMKAVKDIPQINPDAIFKVDRPARILLGWMNDERAKFFLSGGLQGIDKPEYAEKILRARESVNSRPAGLNQTEIIEEPPDELRNHINKLIEHPVVLFALQKGGL